MHRALTVLTHTDPAEDEDVVCVDVAPVLGLVGPEVGFVAPELGVVAPELGVVAPELGLV